MFKIKICGITSLDDALQAHQAGADALGFVFHPPSPRNLSAETAAAIIGQLPPFIQTVGLFVNQPPQLVNQIADRCGLDIIQLHGEETPDYCRNIRRRVIKAFRVKDRTVLQQLSSYQVAGYLLDAWSAKAHGGTGERFNWEIAAEAVTTHDRIILAGGLTTDTVGGAIRSVKPYAVDVSSGVETAPGKKDPQLLHSFIQTAREAYRDIS